MLRKLAVVGTLLFAAVGPVSAAGPQPFVGDTAFLITDVTANIPLADFQFRSEEINGFGRAGGASAEIREVTVPPVPGDGSIVAGGTVVRLGMLQPRVRRAADARTLAYVVTDELELFGGSARGGVTVRGMSVTADVDCRTHRIVASTSFRSVSVAGSELVPSSLAPGTVVTVGPFTLLFGEQRTADRQGIGVVGLHVLGPATGSGLRPLDVRVGTIEIASRCLRRLASRAPTDAVDVQVSAADRVPTADRAMQLVVRVTNRSGRPCSVTSLEMRPGPVAWRVVGTAGPLGSSYYEPRTRSGDAIVDADVELLPGESLWQRFAVGLSGTVAPDAYRAGSTAAVVCGKTGLHLSPLSGFPRP